MNFNKALFCKQSKVPSVVRKVRLLKPPILRRGFCFARLATRWVGWVFCIAKCLRGYLLQSKIHSFKPFALKLALKKGVKKEA
ncbi:hypothetical protein DMC01_13210 [Campylobacter troglodytis]|nr:hypothetical protein DMC01_13210 [Campylobacter troglodytis]